MQQPLFAPSSTSSSSSSSSSSSDDPKILPLRAGLAPSEFGKRYERQRVHCLLPKAANQLLPDVMFNPTVPYDVEVLNFQTTDVQSLERKFKQDSRLMHSRYIKNGMQIVLDRGGVAFMLRAYTHSPFIAIRISIGYYQEETFMHGHIGVLLLQPPAARHDWIAEWFDASGYGTESGTDADLMPVVRQTLLNIFSRNCDWEEVCNGQPGAQGEEEKKQSVCMLKGRCPERTVSWLAVNKVFLQKEDQNCQTWIWWYLYERTVQKRSPRDIMEQVQRLTPQQRFEGINAWFYKMLELGQSIEKREQEEAKRWEQEQQRQQRLETLRPREESKDTPMQSSNSAVLWSWTR